MVVQPAGFDQFVHPGIETVDAGVASECEFVPALPFAVLGQHRLHAHHIGLPSRPDFRALLQPADPIGAPAHFLHEFFGAAEAMRGDGSSGDFGFADQPAADGGGQK